MLRERAMEVAQEAVNNLRRLADGKTDLMGNELSRAALVIEVLAYLREPARPTSHQILQEVGTKQGWNSDTELKLLLVLAYLRDAARPTSHQILQEVGTKQGWNSDTELKLLLDYLDEVWSNDELTNPGRFQQYLRSRAEYRNLD